MPCWLTLNPDPSQLIMQIQIKEVEIIAAIKEYLVRKGLNLHGKSLNVVFTARRNNSGLTADVEINDAGIPGFSDGSAPQYPPGARSGSGNLAVGEAAGHPVRGAQADQAAPGAASIGSATVHSIERPSAAPGAEASAEAQPATAEPTQSPNTDDPAPAGPPEVPVAAPPSSDASAQFQAASPLDGVSETPVGAVDVITEGEPQLPRDDVAPTKSLFSR